MWIWENYKNNALYRVAEKPLSPMLETTSHDEQAVNIIPRFEPVFLPMFGAGFSDIDKRGVENGLLHYLALLDIAAGLDRRELGLRRLASELAEGKWGPDVREMWEKLPGPERKTVLKLLYEQEKTRELLLDRALKELFPGCHVYRVQKTDEIILSLPQAKTPENDLKMGVLLELFAPFGQKYLLYWQITPCALNWEEASLGSCALG